MKTYHKYLPISQEDEDWGLCTLNAGYGKVELECRYPSTDHPSSYYFNWAKGRILSEYQLIYITHGEGIFESRNSGIRQIKEGSVILLFPNEWHRYKPNEHTGWNEYWVGFRGPIADNLMRKNFFSPVRPVLRVGHHEEIISLFNDIAERTKKELSGYQPLVSGEIVHLLGLVHSLSKGNFLKDHPENTVRLIQQAQVIFRENIETNIPVEEVASQLGLSYSLFRKIFKKYTGISPGQYLIQLKIEQAKLLLVMPEKMVKEVAYELGFESCFYFSRLFKEKTGLSPAAYRDRYTGPVN